MIKNLTIFFQSHKCCYKITNNFSSLQPPFAANKYIELSSKKPLSMQVNIFNPVRNFCICIILLVACNKHQEDTTCISFSKAPVSKIEGATTATVNQEIPLTISFGCFNGCGSFGNVEQISNGNTTTIIVNAKYQGCVCTQDAPTRQTTYLFKKAMAGTYVLKFQQTETTYLMYTITVQ
jgi:hypothetical protein